MHIKKAAQLIGAGVVYTPTMEDGVITSVNEKYVFVRFRDSLSKWGVACNPWDLEVMTQLRDDRVDT